MLDDENNRDELLAMGEVGAVVDEINRVVKQNEDKDLNQLSLVFGEEASNKNTDLPENTKKIFALLRGVTSMMLTPRSNNEPFQALMQMADGRRSALPCDLTSGDIDVLSSLIGDVSHNLLKARIGDLLWVCKTPKNHEHAKIAINCYIFSGINPESWRLGGKDEFERAYRLAQLINDSDLKLKIENALSAGFFSDINGFNEITFSIAELIDELRILKDSNRAIAVRLEAIGELMLSKEDFQSAIRFFDLASKKYMQEEDESQQISMLVKTAECYALDAEKHFVVGGGSMLLASSFYETAIHAYRKIPTIFREEYGVDNKISELRHKLNEAGKNSLVAMGVIQTPFDDTEETIKLSKEHVSQKKSPYEALVYFSGVCLIPDYKLLAEREKENMRQHPLTNLFGSTQYSSDGRVVSKTPAVGLDGDSALFEAALNDSMVRSFNYEIGVKVQLCLIPALNQILQEHTISKYLIDEMCSCSPLIPKKNVLLVSRAIWLGFEFDFFTAIHLITSQIENIVRAQLKNEGGHTTHLDSNGIEHENGLSTLLEMNEANMVFGDNILFELKAVFTDSIGSNLRNEVAHGLLNDNGARSAAPVYAWWMLLRMLIHSLITSPQNSD